MRKNYLFIEPTAWTRNNYLFIKHTAWTALSLTASPFLALKRQEEFPSAPSNLHVYGKACANQSRVGADALVCAAERSSAEGLYAAEGILIGPKPGA